MQPPKNGFNLIIEKVEKRNGVGKTSCWLLINNRWGCQCKITFNLLSCFGTLRCWGPGPLFMGCNLEGLASVHFLQHKIELRNCFRLLGNHPQPLILFSWEVTHTHDSLIMFLNLGKSPTTRKSWYFDHVLNFGEATRSPGNPHGLIVLTNISEVEILGSHPQTQGNHCGLNLSCPNECVF